MKHTLAAFAAATCLLTGTARASLPPAVPFVEDDYARAVADAKARGVPLFVEIWAEGWDTWLARAS